MIDTFLILGYKVSTPKVFGIERKVWTTNGSTDTSIKGKNEILTTLFYECENKIKTEEDNNFLFFYIYFYIFYIARISQRINPIICSVQGL